MHLHAAASLPDVTLISIQVLEAVGDEQANLIYGATALPFDPEEVTRLFMHSQREFWGRFGLMGLHALTSWLLTVPVIVAGIYFPLRPALRRLNQTRRKTSVP